MEATVHGELRGYTYKQAFELIGAANMNYIRQLVSQGKIRIVGQAPVKEGSEVMRVLLNVDDVEKVAANFKTRTTDDLHTFELKLNPEHVDELSAWLVDHGYDGEVEDVTVARREYQKKRKANKA